MMDFVHGVEIALVISCEKLVKKVILITHYGADLPQIILKKISLINEKKIKITLLLTLIATTNYLTSVTRQSPYILISMKILL